MKRVLFIPDAHHPYIDTEAWSLMLKAAKQFKPDVVVVLGDFFDFFAVSQHSKTPERSAMLEIEIAQASEALTQLEALDAEKLVYIEGNHEYRLHRYLCDKAPALFGIVSVEKLLDLKQRGWEYVKYRKTYRLGKLRITHDLGKAGPNAHRDALRTFRHSALIGHVHSIGYSVVGSPEEGGSPAVGASFGWLGSFDQIDYMHEAAARAAWSHGFGVGYLMPDGVVHLTPVPIVKGTCVVEGRLIK